MSRSGGRSTCKLSVDRRRILHIYLRYCISHLYSGSKPKLPHGLSLAHIEDGFHLNLVSCGLLDCLLFASAPCKVLHRVSRHPLIPYGLCTMSSIFLHFHHFTWFVFYKQTCFLFLTSWESALSYH